MADVYLSYLEADRPLADRVTAGLSRHGLVCRRPLATDDEAAFVADFEAALAEVRWVVVLLTRESAGEPVAWFAASTAHVDAQRIIVLLADDVPPDAVPLGLRTRRIVRLRDIESGDFAETLKRDAATEQARRRAAYEALERERAESAVRREVASRPSEPSRSRDSRPAPALPDLPAASSGPEPSRGGLGRPTAGGGSSVGAAGGGRPAGGAVNAALDLDTLVRVSAEQRTAGSAAGSATAAPPVPQPAPAVNRFEDVLSGKSREPATPIPMPGTSPVPSPGRRRGAMRSGGGQARIPSSRVGSPDVGAAQEPLPPPRLDARDGVAPKRMPAPVAAPAQERAPSRMPASAPRDMPGVGMVAAIVVATLLVGAVLFSRSPDGQSLFSRLVAALGFKLNAFNFFGLLSRKPREPDKPPTDLVDCSVFAPAAAPPGATVLVQVFLHTPPQAERAGFLAAVMDAGTAFKGVQTLQTEVARGAKVGITLSAPGLAVEDPAQVVLWRGEPVFAQFLVTLPADAGSRTFHAVVRIAVDGGLVGRIVFAIGADAAVASVQSAPAGRSARRYEHAFLSYASADRKEVLKRAQVLKAAGVGFFQDILSLDPGARWERELYRNIDRCDLFLLFWSRAARDSEWVIREAEYALARAGDGDVPDIVPVILEGPPVIKPPDSLQALHFNDPISYLVALS